MAASRRMRTFRRILHATDFSTASRPAFRKAIELTKAHRGRLLVVHVLPVIPLLPEDYITADTYDRILQSQRAGARKHLARRVASAKAAGARATGILVDVGVPAERIARLAKSRHADLIVMGTHGRTGVRRVLLGSVAARVVAIAGCPVMTVHA